MPRKHLFALVVLFGAAVVAGLLALTRTVELGQPANASTGSDPAIAFRLKELDRFEASLRQQLAKGKAPAAVRPQTVYQRAASPAAQPAASSHDEHEDEHEGESEHEDEGRDD